MCIKMRPIGACFENKCQAHRVNDLQFEFDLIWINRARSRTL